jgi:hypothetical protein
VSVAKRKSKTFPSKWKLIYTLRTDIPPAHNRIAEVMNSYMFNHAKHNIQELERLVMNQYEEAVAMNRLDGLGVRFRWICTAKQHVKPFSERYCFAIYSGKTLLACVFEPSEFGGKVVVRKDYRTK